MTVISPTVGRIVLYRPAGSDPAAQPHAAIVTFVHDDRCVNLAIFNEGGSLYHGTQVTLVQDGDATPETGYAEWMPYQKGQAAKTESAEGTAAKLVTDLALDVDAKFKSLGDWLTPALKGIEDTITALSTPAQPAPPLAPPPANPPAPADASQSAAAADVSGAGQQAQA